MEWKQRSKFHCPFEKTHNPSLSMHIPLAVFQSGRNIEVKRRELSYLFGLYEACIKDAQIDKKF